MPVRCPFLVPTRYGPPLLDELLFHLDGDDAPVQALRQHLQARHFDSLWGDASVVSMLN